LSFFFAAPLLFFLKTILFGLQASRMLRQFQLDQMAKRKSAVVFVQLEDAQFRDQLDDMVVIDDFLSWLLV
jgi:hypothetical protein